MIKPPPSESDNPIKIYLREIGEVPLISVQEELRLAELIQNGMAAEKELCELDKKGNHNFSDEEKAIKKNLEEVVEKGQAARQQMIKSNLRLVVKIAQDYSNYGLPLLDLISEGNIGLMKAVERFEPTHGAKLSTYAAWWIKQAVKRALANQGKTIRLPVHITDKISKLRRLSSQLTEEFGREPTDEELAEELRVSPSKIAEWRNIGIRPASLNAMMGEDEDGLEFGEVVSDEAMRSPDELIGDEDLTQEMLKCLEVLEPREREILACRYGLDGETPLTLEEVGEKFQVTRERIRQLQKVSLNKLKRALDKKDRVR
ncbi:MAG: sigma-70 family RNA polymerase sigma factor [Verrucomicrobiae bacterium]|nr:sigma-70 family RNA polymerase sigma factor [Verrucomicrobiae bacterium]